MVTAVFLFAGCFLCAGGCGFYLGVRYMEGPFKILLRQNLRLLRRVGMLDKSATWSEIVEYAEGAK